MNWREARDIPDESVTANEVLPGVCDGCTRCGGEIHFPNSRRLCIRCLIADYAVPNAPLSLIRWHINPRYYRKHWPGFHLTFLGTLAPEKEGDNETFVMRAHIAQAYYTDGDDVICAERCKLPDGEILDSILGIEAIPPDRRAKMVAGAARGFRLIEKDRGGRPPLEAEKERSWLETVKKAEKIKRDRPDLTYDHIANTYFHISPKTLQRYRKKAQGL